MLPKLKAYAHNDWHNIVTGDESWFDYEYVREHIWTRMDDNAPEVANRTIASQKSMLIVVWNPDGFHVVAILPVRHSFIHSQRLGS
jgi:hypothetical protein